MVDNKFDKGKMKNTSEILFFFKIFFHQISFRNTEKSSRI